MTLLVTVITADRSDTMRDRAREAFQRGTDAVELRLDALSDGQLSIAGIADDLPSGRWIATCRSANEGGRFRGPVEQRIARMLAAGRPGEGFIDIEYADWQRSALARSDHSNAAGDFAPAHPGDGQNPGIGWHRRDGLGGRPAVRPPERTEGCCRRYTGPAGKSDRAGP